MTHTDRIASMAATFAPLRLLLTVLALPFYVVGFLVGLVLVAVMWMWAAVVVGVTDARGRGVSTDGAA